MHREPGEDRAEARESRMKTPPAPTFSSLNGGWLMQVLSLGRLFARKLESLSRKRTVLKGAPMVSGWLPDCSMAVNAQMGHAHHLKTP